MRVRRNVRLARLTCQAWLLLVRIDVRGRGGLPQLQRWLAARAVRRRTCADPADVVWAVDEACVWYVKRARCLQRSMAAVHLLRACGYRAEVVIGYRPVPFESHAWVELDGRVINDRPQYQRVFTVLDRL